MTTLAIASKQFSPVDLPAYARRDRALHPSAARAFISRWADAEACAIFRLSTSSFQRIQLSVNCRREITNIVARISRGRIISRANGNLSVGPALILRRARSFRARAIPAIRSPRSFRFHGDDFVVRDGHEALRSPSIDNSVNFRRATRAATSMRYSNELRSPVISMHFRAGRWRSFRRKREIESFDEP